MKLRISPTILDEVSSAIEDALAHQQRGTADPTDPTYLKIDATAKAAKSHKHGFMIDADANDIAELKDRADYNVGVGGVCYENLQDCRFDRGERIYWLNRIRAYKGLLRQIAALKRTHPPAAPSQENSMNTQVKLSDTQREVIKLATYRPDANIEPLPPALRGGARKKVIDGLLARDLITQFHYPDHVEYYLTDAAFAAVGKKRKAPEPVAPAGETEPAVAPDRPRTRENSKQATVIRMLQRPEGATIHQICEATGWQSHTVRGTFAGAFKKKLGLNLTSDKTDGGERIYRII